jgi:hypothetical protein
MNAKLVSSLRSQMTIDQKVCEEVFGEALTNKKWNLSESNQDKPLFLNEINIPSTNQKIEIGKDVFGSGLKLEQAQLIWPGRQFADGTWQASLLLVAAKSPAGSQQVVGSRFIDSEINLRLFSGEYEAEPEGFVNSCIGEGGFLAPRIAPRVVSKVAPRIAEGLSSESVLREKEKMILKRGLSDAERARVQEEVSNIQAMFSQQGGLNQEMEQIFEGVFKNVLEMMSPEMREERHHR